MTEKLRPFNLEEALAGAPVVTRDGRKVLRIAHFPESRGYKVVALIEGDLSVQDFHEDGRFSSGESECDLFMATPTRERTVWVNVYVFSDGSVGGRVYESRQQAECMVGGYSGNYCGTYPLTFEDKQ